MDEITDLVKFIQQHAITHYEDGGWDVVAECWEAEEIAEHLVEAGATDEAGALAAFAILVDVWAERQIDARISAYGGDGTPPEEPAAPERPAHDLALHAVGAWCPECFHERGYRHDRRVHEAGADCGLCDAVDREYAWLDLPPAERVRQRWERARHRLHRLIEARQRDGQPPF